MTYWHSSTANQSIWQYHSVVWTSAPANYNSQQMKLTWLRSSAISGWQHQRNCLSGMFLYHQLHTIAAPDLTCPFSEYSFRLGIFLELFLSIFIYNRSFFCRRLTVFWWNTLTSHKDSANKSHRLSQQVTKTQPTSHTNWANKSHRLSQQVTQTQPTIHTDSADKSHRLS